MYITVNQLCVGGCVCVCVGGWVGVQLFATPWAAAWQTPLTMEFSKQEHWSRLPFPTPGDLSDPGIKLAYLVSPALRGRISSICTNVHSFFDSFPI